MNQDFPVFLTKEEVCKKYPYFTLNSLKNILYKNYDGFKEKCVRRVGKRKILFNEKELINYIENNKG